MRNKVINALIEMGMPADIKGFIYIVDSVLILSEEKESPKILWIYEVIGRKHNVPANTVERAIRHAFSVVLTKGNLNAVKKYLTLQNTTNGNLLHVLYLRLTQEE